MKVDIEVVGERCRRKGDPRPARAEYDDEDDVIPSRPPTTPEGGGSPVSRDRRGVSTTQQGCLTSWRQPQFYREGSVLKGLLGSERTAVSRGEKGVKVRISYVDRTGRVRASPAATPTERPVSISASYRQQESPFHAATPTERPVSISASYRQQESPFPTATPTERPVSISASYRQQESPATQACPDFREDNDLCGWTTSSPVNNFTERLYRPQRIPSAKDRAFSALLTSSRRKLEIQGTSSFPRRSSERGVTGRPKTTSIAASTPVPTFGRPSRSVNRARSSTKSRGFQPGELDPSASDATTPAVPDTGETGTSEGWPFVGPAAKVGSCPDSTGSYITDTRHVCFDGDSEIYPKEAASNNMGSPSSHIPTGAENSCVHMATATVLSESRIPSAALIPNSHVGDAPGSLKGQNLKAPMTLSGASSSMPDGRVPHSSSHSNVQMPPASSGGLSRISVDTNFHLVTASALPNGHSPAPSQPSTVPTPASSLASGVPFGVPPATATPPLTSLSHNGRLHHNRHRRPSQQSPHLRPFTTTPTGRRVHASVPESVKEALRSLWYRSSRRRANSATTARWRWAAGAGDWARGGRGRSKLSTQQAEKVVQDENAPPSESRMFRKFRLVGFITLTLIRLKAAIVINSLDRTERSAAEIQWRTLFGEQGTEKLAFDKSRFSREKISTKMPSWALRVLDTRPENRSEQDCRRLYTLFKGMRSFDKFTEEIQVNLCRAFAYVYVEESRVVLRRGHIGHSFYFIYSGSVFVNVQDVDTNGEPFIKTEAILGKGESFGELALLQDIRRTATVTVRETCELLAVDRDVFSELCPQIFEKELMEKKNFIHGLDLFNPKVWTQDAIKTICIEAQIQEYKINKIIVDNNKTNEWLYICMEGKCQVIRRLSEEEEDLDEARAKEAIKRRGRAQSMAVLSREIIELLSAAATEQQATQEEVMEESSKEKLLASLGLEYAKTGKRDGIFMHEVAEEERKKAQKRYTAPTTLTALMAQQQGDGRARVVYLNVGSLEAEEHFDLSSLIKVPALQSSNNLMLVSSGAKVLRLKKATFLRLASPEAMEHTKTMVSKLRFPSDATILESYKTMVTWNDYKLKVLKDVIRSRDLRSAPLYRGPEIETMFDPTGLLTHERDHPPSRSGTYRERRCEEKQKKAKVPSVQVTELKTHDETKDKEERKKDDVADADGEKAGRSDTSKGGETAEVRFAPDGKEGSSVPVPSAATAEKPPPPIFPVVEVDTSTYPPTPRMEPPLLHTLPNGDAMPPPPRLAPTYGIGPAPTAVIIHRKIYSPGVYKPYTPHDTKLATGKEKERKKSRSQTTRFLLSADVDSGAGSA